MDKCLEHISFRVPPRLKEEYDALSEGKKKALKAILLDTIGRYCWAEHHYDHDARTFYGIDRGDAP